MASKFRQDMPPPGGYGPIDWGHKLVRRPFSGYATFGAFFAMTTAAWTMYHFRKKTRKRHLVELRDGRFAIEPLLEAEKQRAFLRQLRKNRDEERELMKDVKGWEVGKINGEPVYHNLADRFHVVHAEEYFVHNKYQDMNDRMFLKCWH